MTMNRAEGRQSAESRSGLASADDLQAIEMLHDRYQSMRTQLAGVLVGMDDHLQLADFGIARGNLASGKVVADAFNPGYAPGTISDGNKKHWSAQEDVWQLGMLLAWLVLGRPIDSKVAPKEVRHLPCAPSTKEIIYRCLEVRQFRLRDASALLRLIDSGQSYRLTRVASLRDRTIVFTGTAPLPRRQMTSRAWAAGVKNIRKHISAAVDTVVVGDASPVWAAGGKGRKLLAALQMRDQGQNLHFISARTFVALTSKQKPATKRR